MEEGDPFDLGDVPPTVEAADPVEQSAVYRAIARSSLSDLNPESHQTWARTPEERISLSRLKKIYNQKHAAHAISLLHKRLKMEIDEEFTVDPMSDLVWAVPGHFLDYTLFAANAPGLYACLPTTNPSHTFQFTLKPQPDRDFRARYGRLGFDPKGAMLSLGLAPMGEVWLGMCPHSSLDEDAEHDGETISTSNDLLTRATRFNSRLTPQRYRMLEMFIVYAAAKITDLPVTLRHQYGPPDSKSFADWTLFQVSNFK